MKVIPPDSNPIEHRADGSLDQMIAVFMKRSLNVYDLSRTTLLGLDR